MTAKEYLRQIAVLDAKISRRQTEIEELKTRATHITTMFDENKVQSSGGSDDRMADVVTRWIIMEEEVTRMTDQLVGLKHKVIGEIHKLEDVRYIQILEMRYLDLCTFEQIAVTMHMDIRHIFRLHGYALQEFTKRNMS